VKFQWARASSGVRAHFSSPGGGRRLVLPRARSALQPSVRVVMHLITLRSSPAKALLQRPLGTPPASDPRLYCQATYDFSVPWKRDCSEVGTDSSRKRVTGVRLPSGGDAETSA